jgi:hypothetical protein
MDFNWSILGWIAGLIFVYIFGLFEGRGQGYKRRKAEEEQEKKDQPAPPPAAPETISVDDPGLLRIKDENGSYVLCESDVIINGSAPSPDRHAQYRASLAGRANPTDCSAGFLIPADRPACPVPHANHPRGAAPGHRKPATEQI